MDVDGMLAPSCGMVSVRVMNSAIQHERAGMG